MTTVETLLAADLDTFTADKKARIYDLFRRHSLELASEIPQLIEDQLEWDADDFRDGQPVNGQHVVAIIESYQKLRSLVAFLS